MKFKTRIFSIPLLFVVVFLSACTKEEEPVSPNISTSVSEISEDGFRIHWSSNLEITTLNVEVSRMSDLSDPDYEHLLNQPIGSSHPVEGLKGATKYYVRLVANFADGTTPEITTFTQETSYRSEVVTIDTPDGLELSGKLSYLEGAEGPRPAVIFMHEMGAFVNNWKAAAVVKSLVSEGCVCLAFDFRGHGNSTPIPDLGVLIEDWSLLTTDLVSAMDYLKGHPRVDSSSIALAGGSLGGIMACAGNGFEEVRSSVALSPAKMGVYTMFPDHVLTNVLYIVGELDIHENPSVNFPEEATYLYDLTDEPRKLVVVNSSSSHGTDLLGKSGVDELIVEWILTGFE